MTNRQYAQRRYKRMFQATRTRVEARRRKHAANATTITNERRTR